MDPTVPHISHEMPMPMPMPGGEGHHHGGGDGGMGMGECQMSMVWNTSTRGMCVVFDFWKVNGKQSFWFTLIALFFLASMLEYLRFKIRFLDVQLCSIHRLNAGNNINGSHRRKASVQQVLGVAGGHNHHHSVKATSIGGPTLTTSSIGVGLGGDRRVSPSYTPTDNHSNTSSSRSDDDLPLLPGGGNYWKPGNKRRYFGNQDLIPPLPITNRAQINRSILYVITLTLSMFIMLVFMTYNAWLIVAVLSGAATGHYLFNRDVGIGLLSEDKAVCH